MTTSSSVLVQRNSTDYDARFQVAVAEYRAGRRRLSEHKQNGTLVRHRNNYAPIPSETFSCCYDILWDSSYLTRHLATARHIAEKYRVSRKDLLATDTVAFLQGRGSQ